MILICSLQRKSGNLKPLFTALFYKIHNYLVYSVYSECLTQIK